MMKNPAQPSFICIGPEKTGTSFLFSVLKKHPHVQLPIIKELRYWSEGSTAPNHSLSNLFFSKHWHYISLRRKMFFWLKHDAIRLAHPNFEKRRDARWKFRFIFGKRSDVWYKSLFGNSCKITGDISPYYYHLPEQEVASIARSCPSTKIIIFIREPVDRAWSKAKMNLVKHKDKNITDLEFDNFQSYCDSLFDIWVPYEETIAIWQKYFSQVYVSIYDDMKSDPETWYNQVCSFLQIEPVNNSALKRVVNKGIVSEIPAKYLKLLVTQYGAETEKLARTYAQPSWKKSIRTPKQ